MFGFYLQEKPKMNFSGDISKLKIKKWSSFFLVIIFFIEIYHCQCGSLCGSNLIPNPGFENTTNICLGSSSENQIYLDQSPLSNWIGTAGLNSPNNGITPDNFNSNCGGNGTQTCGNGSGSAGFFTTTNPGASSTLITDISR